MPILTGESLRAALTANPETFLRQKVITLNLQTPSPADWSTLVSGAVMAGPLRTADSLPPLRFSDTVHNDPDEMQGTSVYVGQGNTLLPIHTPTIDASGNAVAYVLPWMRNGGCFTILEPDADLFFTATLTGCGLGWTRGTDGSVRIGHANIVDDQQNGLEPAMATALSIYNTALLPSAYRALTPEGSCNVVGVRTPAGWTLYAQVLQSMGLGAWKIRHVQPLTFATTVYNAGNPLA